MSIRNEVFKSGVGLTISGQYTTFRVWAPNALAVGLLGDFNDWQETPLTSDGDGYWHVRLKGVRPGANYRYLVSASNGEKLLRKDPRSLQMTDSADGASVVPDFDFDWGEDNYIAPPKDKVVIYELHIGTFARADRATVGNFYDAIRRLDYLKDLGVTTIELMPVTSVSPIPGPNAALGYATCNIYTVNDGYGGRRAMMEFVRECHARGMGVILDVVYNHHTNDNLWRFDGWSENDSGGIYFYNDERATTPWGVRPDYGRPEVRQYILDNVKMWLVDFRLDGLRVDSTIYMRNRNGWDGDPAGDIGDAWTLLGSICELAHRINPRALMIAEDCAGSDYLTKPVAEGGCGFDAQWDLSLPHALRRAISGQSEALDGVCYTLSHRFNGDSLQSVVFADSHDSAGNGAERITDMLNVGKRDCVAAKKIAVLAAAVTLTTPGIPMILQGQEFMQDGAFCDWVELDWKRVERFSGVVLANRHLVALRENRYDNTRGLLGGEMSIFHRNDLNRVLGYRRSDGDGNDVLVIVNFSNERIRNYEMTLPAGGIWTVRFNSCWSGYGTTAGGSDIAVIEAGENGEARLDLLGYMVVILSR